MVKRFFKNTETWEKLQLPAIRKVCQDACQRLILHPYITASRIIIYNLKLNSSVGH